MGGRRALKTVCIYMSHAHCGISVLRREGFPSLCLLALAHFALLMLLHIIISDDYCSAVWDASAITVVVIVVALRHIPLIKSNVLVLFQISDVIKLSKVIVMNVWQFVLQLINERKKKLYEKFMIVTMNFCFLKIYVNNCQNFKSCNDN